MNIKLAFTLLPHKSHNVALRYHYETVSKQYLYSKVLKPFNILSTLFMFFSQLVTAVAVVAAPTMFVIVLGVFRRGSNNQDS